jgi:thiol:disulfide interchange protein
MPRFLFFFIALLSLSSLSEAQFGLTNRSGATSSVATLVSETSSIAPGETFTVALELKHPDGWHSYYQNSGGVELPPSLTWTLPAGFTAGPIQWPTPQVKDGYFGKSFIYPGTPVFLVEISAPSSLKTGETVTLSAKAKWQICKETCIDESKDFTLQLPVSATAQPDPAQADLFANARKNQPVSSNAWKITAQSAADEIVLLLEPQTGAAARLDTLGLDFIPDQPFLKPLSDGGKLTADGENWKITLQRNTVDFLENPIPQGKSFSGILTASAPLDTSLSASAIRIPDVKIASPPAAPLPFSKLLPILGGMFLGGLLLNLMPCVFPVIGLKIMGFVQQAGADRKKIVFHGLTFALGVLASFAVISGVLFAARLAAEASGSDAIGWGYQLQNPWIVLGLMLLMFVLALNMFGLFELGASATSVGGSLQSKQGLAGSFFSGVLATVVATPCSAPFLGVAIGAAVALPAIQFFSAFAAMAIGLALPYLLLSAFPGLLKFLPRPGAWMESFKQAMSFLLFATAGFLLWVYAGQIGLENLLGPVFGLTSIAIAAWIYGRWNLPHRPKRTRMIAWIFTIAFAVGGFFMLKPPVPSELVWEKWSPETVESLLKEGKPVYVDFTAQWCATCQVNKKRAYTPYVIALMKQKGIVALKADKTNPDPIIEAELQKLGRTAIPVNVLLVPGKKPIVTPELLSPGTLTELFSNEIPVGNDANPTP